MRTTDRFPLTGGPREFNPDDKAVRFRSGNVEILFLVDSTHEENDFIAFEGKTHVRGYPEPKAVAHFRPQEQSGWIEYP